MSFIRDFTIIGGVILAAFFDIKERRIPNWIVYPGMLLGLLLGVMGEGVESTSSLLGLVFGIMTLFLPFAFGWVGAGDVKLMGATGALLGYRFLPRVCFYTCIAAGIIALIALTLGKARKRSFVTFWTGCSLAFLTAGRSLTREDIDQLGSDAYSVPWAVAIGAGTVMAYYIDSSGKLAGF